jgi:hemin uptake protein HemP
LATASTHFFPTFAVTNNDPAMNPPTPPPEMANAPGCDLRTLRSDELLQGQVEVLIAHGNDTYRLRLTRSGKLILQK